MISIYDEILTNIKSNLNISSNMNRLYEEAVVIKPVSGSLLSLIIPLFNYDEVLISSDKLFNVMADGSIIIEDYSVNDFKFDSVNDNLKQSDDFFNISLLANDSLLIILYDEYGNIFDNATIEVYTSNDGTNYTLDDKITTDKYGQVYYQLSSDYTKFKYKEVYSNVIEL